MPRTKRRSSSATIVSPSAIEQAGLKLQKLPEKPKETWSLRESVALLQDAITTALHRGYSYEEIVEILAEKDIDITVSSLKRYLATARREREENASSSKRRTRRTRRAAQSVAPMTVVSPASQTKAAKSATPRRGRPPRAAESINGRSSKTAAKAQPQAKTRAKTTSSRARKSQ
ncbi:MAG: hypothetical protein IGS38_05665 [Synechococcales cyanobacterium M58_A2018_015]|nr:hypothetical protein [Synechococcales cyanobacterium M58_A2018_015]